MSASSAMRRCCDARRADAPSGTRQGNRSEKTEAVPHTSETRMPDDNRTIRARYPGSATRSAAGASRESGSASSALHSSRPNPLEAKQMLLNALTLGAA